MKFEKTEISNIDVCFICEQKGALITQLKDFPITELFEQKDSIEVEKTLPSVADQALLYCQNCNHVLGKQLPKHFVYQNYLTETSKSGGATHALKNFFFHFVSANSGGKYSSIIDIGANDSSLLKMFESGDNKLVGVDPNMKSDNPNIKCVNEYIEDSDLNEYGEGRKIIVCSHTLEHMYEVRSFFENLISKVSYEDDIFFQFPSLELLVLDSRFDQINHQHLNYFSLKSINSLLQQIGFSLIKHKFDPDHFGALMIHIKKSQSENYVLPTDYLSNNLDDILKSYDICITNFESLEKRIQYLDGDFYCFGASLLYPILLYNAPSLNLSKGIIDGSQEKQKLKYLRINTPIISDEGINYSENNFIVSAIGSKLAARTICAKLFSSKGKNVILPLNLL